MTLVVSPSRNSLTVLNTNVGDGDHLLCNRITNVRNTVIARWDRDEIAKQSTEREELRALCRNYNGSTVGDNITATGALVVFGWLGWLGGPILGIITGYVAGSISGGASQIARLRRNRVAGQQIVKKIAKIGLERVKRLSERVEQIDAVIKQLETKNNKLSPSRFRLLSPSTWLRQNSSQPISRAAERQVTTNIIMIKGLLNVRDAFRKTHLAYLKRFSEIAFRQKSFRVDTWTYGISYRNDVLAVDTGTSD